MCESIVMVTTYREHIVKNVNKIVEKSLKIKVVAPLHGLVWKRSPQTIIDAYLKWAAAEPEKGKL